MGEAVTSNDIRQPDSPITCLTCYDYLTARVMDQVQELDMILVGDSLGNVMLGRENTLSVTVDDMVHHTAAVSRAVDRAFLVSDIPFLEMARSRDHLVGTVQRLMGEAGAQAVKIEGGEEHAESIELLIDNDVPVVGHLGLTPQSVEAFGGYHVRGREEDDVKQLGRDARRLEELGVLAVVLECVPGPVAKQLSEMIEVPTIGIGAGAGCDGQVLVWQDMMGLSDGAAPSFVRKWGNFNEDLADGVRGFCEAVRTADFPDDSETFSLPDDVDDEQVKRWLSAG